ncbi:MAG TPA: peptidoglycan editing factor PgeF [Candidatus Acidoferrales bacterium]|nr:peptidoglycan editing factor PgeF [Candidatus Acidoferrales bacterium]
MSLVKSRAKTQKNLRRKAAETRSPVWRAIHGGNLQIIKSAPLEKIDGLVHGFSTRPGGNSVLENSPSSQNHIEEVLNLGFTDWDSRDNVEANRRRFIETLGAKKFSLVTLRQMHSDVVYRADSPPSHSLAGDALITRTSSLLLAIQTADCVPILLADPQHRAVAAVHAGWRGTLSRIAAKTVGRMQMEFGSQPENLFAALGPGIHPCCYEVGPDVVKEFSAQFPQARDWFEGPFDAMSSGEDPNPLPWLSMTPPGHEPPPPRCHLNLYAANASILAAAGIKSKNIFSSELCTACRTDLLFSYRREGRTGRMMAVIGIE